MRFLLTPRSLSATLAVATLALVLTAPNTAFAQQTYYGNLTAFNAAATTNKLYDFENITPYNLATNPAELKVAAPGRITFSVSGGPNPEVYAINPNYEVSLTLNGTYTVWAGYNRVNNLSIATLSLDNLYTAFSIELGQTGHVTNNYSIGLYNGNTQIGTDFVTGTTGDYFFGVTSTTAFNNIRVSAMQGKDSANLFDNARTGSAIVASVPEAGTLTLALPALGIVGAVLIRRKK